MSLAITIIRFTLYVQGTQSHEENQIQIENYNNMIRSVTAGWLCYGHTKEEETKDGRVFTEQVTFRVILQTSVEIQRAHQWNWNASTFHSLGTDDNMYKDPVAYREGFWGNLCDGGVRKSPSYEAALLIWSSWFLSLTRTTNCREFSTYLLQGSWMPSLKL